MSHIHRILAPTLVVVFLSPFVSLGQMRQSAVPVQWDTLRNTAFELRQSMLQGAVVPAHMRIIQMELVLGGSPHVSEVGNKLAVMESRPIPGDNDPLLTASLLPTVNQLLQAISETNSTAVNSYLQRLSSSIGAIQKMRSRGSRATLAGTKGGPYFELMAQLEHSLYANDVAASVVLATEMQGMLDDMISKHEYANEYAFNLYQINDALGRAAFLSGDYKSASDYLQKAAEPPSGSVGTVRLDVFGPNLWLAQQLLHVGKRDVVLKFLVTCRERFWTHDTWNLDKWIAAVQQGDSPDFLPNSFVGFGYLEN